ncbi:hypothetical protein [Streptomyces sp.]|uniref:hypothetical protein n=1 Tax=Streptomyces sp. TaxID=1931 RepID=UPI002D7836FA|nr:hypothetical protein [Streptomyces sp.]HET6358934.1 hypothetical protein [Streptomyces sp.]
MLNTSARQYLTALSDYAHALGRGSAGEHTTREASELEQARAAYRRCCAELQMLDPNRIVPPALAHLVKANPELPLDTPQIWAAFTHQAH